jgi:xanthine dehydrogenase accessory factor
LREIVQQISDWQAAGEQVAVATVIRIVGSAPRPVGARLLVSSSGAFAGSVSGGCVEGAVIQEAVDVMRDGNPRMLHFGITEEMSWEVGLACGGTIDVLVQAAAPQIWQSLAASLARGESCVLLTVVGGEQALGRQAIMTNSTPPADWPFPQALTAAQAALAGQIGRPELIANRVLIEPFTPPPHLIVFGGVHAAVPLTQMAKVLGFSVTVVDPRARFANRDRFPEADQILVQWPDQALAQLPVDGRSAIVILTHDPKIDEPALTAALMTDAFYVGAIGSRKTHRDRLERMADQGMTAKDLERVYSPIGLDIGGRSPEEMALSILAEMVAVRNGRRGGFLLKRQA